MIIKTSTIPFYAKLALVLIGLITLGFLIILGKEVLDPLMFGFLFAILLLPVSNFFERKLKLPRSMAGFLSILLLVSFVGGIGYLVGSQISNLANDWPQLKDQIGKTADDAQVWIQHSFHINAEKQNAYVKNTATKVMSSGGAVLGTTFGAVSGLLLFYAFIMIFTFLILLYRRLLFKFVLKVFGEEEGQTSVVYDIVENIQRILRQYILGLLLEMVIVSTVACIAFLILGVKYGLLLGVITGLFNIIPYIGIFSALLLSSLITFATGAVAKALIVAICVIVIHLLDANLLLPLVVGSKVRLNALITFLGIVLGEMLWGLSGMFLSIPTIAIMKIIFDHVEGLKPWGYLLGGDYEYKEQAQEKMKTE
ncbi:AI-2E family transporter [Mucilaginibacter robiniae]|uniref:AI-2E family transporter n=1 Tax=Mucilaginibacter robiniae TaxID=2728022 RepID=A0A7L5EAJ6_9SPHI|nr:AI-2E family transporter [Mucilaginibacter robiniae]QJD97406.1 AI-2E family transporter [Mucilaginibacter robiniae]